MVEFRKYKQFSRLVQEVVVVKVLKRYDTNKTNHNLHVNQLNNQMSIKLVAKNFIFKMDLKSMAKELIFDLKVSKAMSNFQNVS